MRRIIVLSFVTMDGIMQAPGGPTEDPSGGFPYGGWLVPYFDDVLAQIMGEQMGRPFDLLLGRKTFEIFASYCGPSMLRKDRVSTTQPSMWPRRR